MNEGNLNKRSAQTDSYINRVSSTIVVLFKIIGGTIAGYVLYYFIRILVPALAELSKGIVDVNQALQPLLEEYGLSRETINSLKKVSLDGVTLPYIVWLGIVITIVISLLLVVIEALSLVALRVAKKGASLVKGIHQIYMVVCIMNLVLFGVSAYQYCKNMNIIQADLKKAVSDLSIPVIVYASCYFFILLLNFCYHKDIAMAMDTVAYETETGNLGKLRKTHLSGISFLFGLPYFLIVLFIAFGLYGLTSGEQLAEKNNITQFQAIASICIPAVMMIKHLAVCFCNRNLKKAR